VRQFSSREFLRLLQLLQLPLLRKADYSEILNDLFPNNNFVIKKEIQYALEDIEGPPRLLQVLLYESSERGTGQNIAGPATVLERQVQLDKISFFLES
jgi:hypothetical protein